MLSVNRGKTTEYSNSVYVDNCLSMESIRLGGPAHGIVTKTVHKTRARVWWGSRGWVDGWLGWVVGGPGDGGVKGWLGVVGSRGG